MANFGTGAWIAFGLTFGVLFAVDLFAHRHAHQLSRRAAIIWTVLWIVAGVGFSLFVLVAGNSNQAGEYLAAYAIEKTLSLDNLFVFLLVFNSLKLSKAQQRKALSWGIFGALVFRAALIFAGTSAIEQWKWLREWLGVTPGSELDSLVLSENESKGQRVAPPLEQVPSRWFEWPRGRHSEKPEAFLDLVESVSPGPYLELFARRNRLGWDTWGNEALEHVGLETG